MNPLNTGPSFLLRRAEEWRFEGIHSSSISTPQSANLRRVGRRAEDDWMRVRAGLEV